MSNYTDVKNYLHNDLGITKEYVDNLITELVKKEVKKVFNDTEYIQFVIKGIIYDAVNEEFVGNNFWHTIRDMSSIIKDDINNAIYKEVKDRIVISLKEDTDDRS